ncbi:hypothetical protein QMG61_02090 [Cryobacterium sp. PH31-AA6]|uniref:hypothetical protein n=1 Tax=Cryobacterium sp. PH31-AA6 TaxID=3046205 RepID=UPI0024BBCD48|nr:hypothetical protein [Cryobacterium sp. PH31-AA6]MDJ0322555.1 hypothetical protein [Cryobacterium sp. PH31-AA6]
MKRIFHLGGSVVTGSEIADAVMHYAQSLSGRSQIGTVDIPIITDTGEQGRAQFLIGASSQLVSVTSGSILCELVEAATTDDLRRRALVGTNASMVGWTGDGFESPQFDEFDY